MISTPIAPAQHPHNLSQPFRAPFRDHLSKRHPSQSMFPFAHRPTTFSKQSGHSLAQNEFGGYRQGFYAQAKPAPKPVQQQAEMGTPEHMLRRKTPNGTLKAGYDGTPVEWASRPPAHKQQLRSIPRDDGAEAALRRQARVLLSGPTFDASQYSNVHSPGTFDSYGSSNYADSQTLNNRQMFQRTGQTQPMDSMLYQVPAQSKYFSSGYANVPIAMQPTWPRNIEPTASGPPMPYGPYWPNGAFEPYRPAALRDARFQAQFAQINLNDPADTKPWSRQPSDFERPPLRDSIYLGPATVGSTAKLDNRAPQQLRRVNANPMFFDGAAAAAAAAASDTHAGYATPILLPNSDLPFNSGREFSKQSMAAGSAGPQMQFKEMALSQAHRTYMALLSFIQQTRKQNQQNKQGHKSFPSVNLFPKPPRNSYPLDTNPTRPSFARDPRLSQRSASYSSFGSAFPSQGGVFGSNVNTIGQEAQSALDLLRQLAQESGWTWIDAILLGGCLAYGLNNLSEAVQWFQKVLQRDPGNVEAMSNLAAAFMTMNRRKEAENLWTEAVKQRPTFFEAVEHLVGLLCLEQRTTDAVNVIQHVENSLRSKDYGLDSTLHPGRSYNLAPIDLLGHPPYSSAAKSGYCCHPIENGRLIALIHAKGNMLYASGNITGAAQAFEEAIMVAVGRVVDGISGLIQRILTCFANEIRRYKQNNEALSHWDAILLLPRTATQTAQMAFPNSSPLPGLGDVQDGSPKKAAVAVTSNCLLSLAKIYQDSMSSGSTALGPPSSGSGVQDILALYYLSLSLQPSPSTANNVGILLAGVQQSATSSLPAHLKDGELPDLPGVVPGTGVALALAYYQYGLHLDKEHAHLYTNLGSLLKDLGQLDLAIKMYEEAVRCDGKFDIALANLANAVKDRGRISDAINYYKRAVDANADFAEAVCGLANALNSVCGWTGRGGVVFGDRRFDRWHVNEEGMLLDARDSPVDGSGWVGRVVAIVNKQLADGRSWGKGVVLEKDPRVLASNAAAKDEKTLQSHKEIIKSWSGKEYEGAKLVRWIERATRRIGWQWYQDKHVLKQTKTIENYRRPQLPTSLSIPNAPTVLPFHTFTCPLSASQIRQISQRNGLRISASTLKAPWLPAHVFRPPPPPKPHLNIGYVSSDFNNHPLAHLMQSVFGMHDRCKFKAFCYATTPSDKSSHRQKIEQEAPVFYDASAWPVDKLVSQIVEDEIHILVNLNGYTRGARNEVFAARPAPIQMSFMGFAGTLGAEWCDYLLADEIAVPPSTLRPCRNNVTLDDAANDENFSDKHNDWVYGENIIYTRDTFFCCDHRQSAPDANEAQLSWSKELERRRAMRNELFPGLKEDVVILGNFNQLYKIEPTTFRTWLRILQAVPKAILWLLRFPDLGEANLRAMAEKWTTPDVSSRIYFTDVAPKHQHIARARVCDLFLDTPECNAHTTAADVLWSGTPLLTYPRYDFKMCSRMAASILKGAMPRGETGEKAAQELTVSSEEEYEEKASRLANGLADVLAGRKENCRALEIRKLLYEGRWSSPLFDTKRWTSDLEEAYETAWTKWEKGEGGDIWL